jgi:hypothetical protein
MADDSIIYAHPTDNIVDAVVPTIHTGGATLAQYPLSHIYDKRPETRMVMAAAGEVIIQWDFVTPVNVKWATMVMPNIPAATANVRLMGNSASSWGAAPLNINFVIPTFSKDGFPWNPWVRNTDVTTYRYWAIRIPAFASAFSVGEIALFDPLRQLIFNINWGANLRKIYPLTEHRTDHNVITEYWRGVSYHQLNGEIDATDAARLAVREWVDAATGRGKRFFIVPEITDNHAWMVKFLNPELLQQLAFLDWTKLTLGWVELSRGLKP